MPRNKEYIELCSLLDGELVDENAKQLYDRLKADSALQAEYEEQRQLKTLLGQLPQHEPPDYLPTRIMGEIASRRARESSNRWRIAFASVSGFTLCLLLVVGFYLFSPAGTGPQPAPMMTAQPVEFKTLPGLTNEDYMDLLTPASSNPAGRTLAEPVINLPDNTTPEVEEFLRFASEAHGYSKILGETQLDIPDYRGAVLVLDGKVYIINEENGQ
jgi:hypothetical protein